MDKEKQIESMVSDAMTDKPIEFSVGSKQFSIKPPTLGKMQILSKCYLELDIDDKELNEHAQIEAMRICEAKTDEVCKLMAVAVCNSKEELINDKNIDKLTEFFKWNCKPEDFCNVMLAILSQTNYENFIISIQLTKILQQNKPT